jgi:aspartyl-tRNA(Asn)/glutamyl-tRNA(Gln) amidotransferase subunit B
MEQDTAKSVAKSSTETILDFNRVSHPLIEIITYPDIHHPATAAAYVRKVQHILKSVGAVTAGMEVGGLRADVNVSIRKIVENELTDMEPKSLGQRTEIKNLISFKAIEDAITSEKNRQIKVLEAGEKLVGETRGWTLGGRDTYRLRGKEGEVDYRYMPDPDLGPLVISQVRRLVELTIQLTPEQSLITHVQETLPMLPDEVLELLTTSAKYNLTEKDAKILISFDDGDRAEYYLDVVEQAERLCKNDQEKSYLGKAAGNMSVPSSLAWRFTADIHAG